MHYEINIIMRRSIVPILDGTLSRDEDPTCNNGFIKLFLSGTKYKPDGTKLSIK